MRRLPLDSPEVDRRQSEAWGTHLGATVADPAAMVRQLGAGSLPEAFAATARRRPSEVAISVDGESVSHGELDRRAGGAAAALARLGVVSGSPVLLVAEVGIEEVVAYLGILRLGATVVLVNPVLTTPEMSVLVAAAQPEIVVGSGPGLGRALGVGAWRAAAGLRPEDGDLTATLLEEDSEATLPVEAVDPGATAILAFTSGSTGHPKPAPLSHRNLLASIRGAMAAWRWSDRDHLVHSLPISHQHGLSGVHATLLAGSRASLLPVFDPERTLASVEAGATIHFGVPAIHQRLLDGIGSRAHELGRLRLAVSGSGPLQPELALRYRDETGQSLLERYGTTESGLDVSQPYDGDRAPGRVGLPLPGVELALVDGSGELVAEGETGEVLLRGPQVFSGYLGVEVESQPFLGDWFRTGDLGSLDPATGHLGIVGRIKEVIITGGMNVYPREVEEVLRRLPGVGDAAVVGMPSDRWGEEVVAVVAPSTVDGEELIRFAAENLAPYKRPKRVIVVAEVPRTPVGKAQRDAVVSLIPPVGG